MKNSPRVCIIDYGAGNIKSVLNIFQIMGASVKLSNNESDIQDATHVVLPGVGAFGSVMARLIDLGIIPLLEKYVRKEKRPFLGICIGMQILAQKGFELGTWNGLGWIPGVVEKMDVGNKILPHMGWNNLNIANPCFLLNRIGSNVDFYFVHSYYFNVHEKSDVSATFEYGKTFTASVRRENIFGVQFHPEKSQKAGRALLGNFLEIR